MNRLNPCKSCQDYPCDGKFEGQLKYQCTSHNFNSFKPTRDSLIGHFSDLDIYKEFISRFSDSTLGDVTITRLLEKIGEKKIKSYLKEKKDHKRNNNDDD